MDYAQLYAGLTAGATTTLLLHPLDYIKTQMQGKNDLFSEPHECQAGF